MLMVSVQQSVEIGLLKSNIGTWRLSKRNLTMYVGDFIDYLFYRYRNIVSADWSIIYLLEIK